MKHLLLLILGISIIPNICHCASAADVNEKSSFTLVDFAFTAVNTYEKFSNLVSMLDDIDSLADKAKLIEIAKRVKILKLELQSVTGARIQEIKQEINSLKLFYLTAINPEFIIKALIKAKFLKEDSSDWLVILLKALNSCQLDEKEKLFLILGLNPSVAIEMLKEDPLRQIIPIALPILEFLTNPTEIPTALVSEDFTKALEKYSLLIQQEEQLQEVNNQIASFKQDLKLSESILLEKNTELKVYVDTLDEINKFQGERPVQLDSAELDIDAQRETLAKEIEILQAQFEEQSTKTEQDIEKLKAQITEIMQALVAELQANALSPQHYKEQNKRVQLWNAHYDTAVNSNIVNFIIQQLGESILLKSKKTKDLLESVAPETQKLLKNRNASIFFPWTMLLTEQDFLNALDFRTIMKLHNIIFDKAELENPMCKVIDSLMPEKYSTARKALFANEASRLESKLSEKDIATINAYKGFSRMATYAPTIIYKAPKKIDAFTDTIVQDQYIKLLNLR